MSEQSSPSPVIEIEDLYTRIGDKWLHEGLNFSVNQGEIMGLIGGSGSGKSMLLRVLLHLFPMVSGTLKLFGESYPNSVLEASKKFAGRLGIMFQRGALFSSMTVLENVGFPLLAHTHLPRNIRNEMALFKLKMVGLSEDTAHKLPAELSGGMVKRVAIARAISFDPELLLLDEPTAGLDPTSAAEVDSMILELRSTLKLTVVIITHDLDTLWNVTDRVAFLAKGRVIQVKPIAELAESQQPELHQYFSGPRGRAAFYAEQRKSVGEKERTE